MSIVTRFAPSPTGYLHAGNYRTALFSYMYARQNGGKFVLRIEDTDKARSKKEYEENILESLEWLGLEYDEFYRQSDRTEVYGRYIQKLIDSGHAYVSEEKPEGENTRESVIRFKNPNRKVVFVDLIRGPIEFDTTELGDFVIARSLNEPVFHLAVVIDDAEIGITHIVRGEDHISNTPRHILLYEALGFDIPKYAHIPLLLSADRSKLSKRKGALPITEYRRRGYLPHAVVNYLALLGWHPSDDKEILSMDELLKSFSLDRVQKSGAVFDEEKLKWFNRQYMLKLSDEEFASNAAAFLPEWVTSGSPTFKRLLPLLRDKSSYFGDVSDFFAAGGELDFLRHANDYAKDMLLWKKNPDPLAAKKHLEKTSDLIGGIPDDVLEAKGAEAVKEAIWPYAEENGKGDVLWPLRVALTGKEKSPDPFICAYVLGKAEAVSRIRAGIEKLSQ